MRILTSHPAFKFSDAFSENELKFIYLLQNDDDIEWLVTNARIRSGIPAIGFNPDATLDEYRKTNALSKINPERISEEALDLLKVYGNLPLSWVRTFIYILLFGLAAPPDHVTYPPIAVQESNGSLTITIKERISVREIKRYLDSYNNLSKCLAKLPELPRLKKDFERLKLDRKILDLYATGMTYKEVGESLDSSEVDFDTDSYVTVGVMGDRARKYVARHVDADLKEMFVRWAYREQGKNTN